MSEKRSYTGKYCFRGYDSHNFLIPFEKLPKWEEITEKLDNVDETSEEATELADQLDELFMEYRIDWEGDWVFENPTEL